MRCRESDVVVIKSLGKMEGWRDGSRDGGKGSEEVRDANRGYFIGCDRWRSY